MVCMENPLPMFRRRKLWLAGGFAAAWPWRAAVAAADPSDSFPAQPAEMVKEIVTVAHGNFERVKAMVEMRPSLAKAAYDWGFGDWEDALGAASHVGNREIAEYLLAKGARPTLFSAAMLGQLETVKAFMAAQPGAQRIAGPHSISLLAHAKAGGKRAEPVYAYLNGLGDAGGPPRLALPAGEAAALAGTYRFGAGEREQIEIGSRNGQLQLTYKGGTARNLVYLGERAFHPVGAEAVRIRFASSDAGMVLTVQDGEMMQTGRR